MKNSKGRNAEIRRSLVKNKFIFYLVLSVVFLFIGSVNFVQAKEKVLLDTDMVEAFDDGVAMIILANAPGIDLVGVTTLSGNSWVEDGTAFALHQLKIEGKDAIPVAAGLAYPLRPQRHELFELERKFMGRGHDSWVGSFGYAQPKSWQDVYHARYGTPTLTPVNQHAVDFIIDTVRANPGEITIAAIGPCGNLAMAIRKAPDIVPMIKRVVYMGGSFYRQGNVTPAAEFNWFFDPEAAKIAVRAPFKEQIVVGLDVCEKVTIKSQHYERMLQTLGNSEQAKLLRNSFVGQSFAKDSNFSFFVWDVIVAAIIIDPTLITEEKTAFIDVNTDYGISYGQSLAYPEVAPSGTQSARIILEIDEEKLWNMLTDKQYWASAQ